MTRPSFHLTATAKKHLKQAVRETSKRWGNTRARRYNADFTAGLQYIANNHEKLHSPHRAALAAGTAFSLHLVEHRYVAFQVNDVYNIIVAGIFHEKMDIPGRLHELNAMSAREIDEVRRVIGLVER